MQGTATKWREGAMDWNKIRAYYLAGGGSYRELAAKYGVSYVTIARGAKSENWRAESNNMVLTKTVEAITTATPSPRHP